MKINTKHFVFAIVFLFSSHFGQSQTLRGTVRDAASGEPLTAANLRLLSSVDTSPSRTLTDVTGRYLFQNLRPGYYTLEVYYGGYSPMIIREISIAGGKETLLDINYNQNVDLPLLTIVNAAARRTPQPLGEIPLTREQTLRFPATFFDPARLAMAYPGVANNDDQANGLNIRGNSPASVRWRLEGLDIVSPNHLPNAGTFSDRPVAASGGVLMFSAQMLDNSALLTGNFPAGYGDALGGMMDMRLRRGNNQRHEFTAQAGLIGLDVAAEGPLWRERGVSYSVNYRYSTVGLLGQMGVNFGDEKINFQDLAVHLTAPVGEGGDISMFGLYGRSDNRFDHKTDSASIKAFKDFFDIDFISETKIFGATWRQNLGAKTQLKVATAWSEQMNDRTSQPFQTGLERQEDHSNEDVQTHLITLTHRMSRQARLDGGATYVIRDYSYRIERDADDKGGSYQTESLQPWASFNWTGREAKTAFVAGLHGMWWLQNGFNLEPRLSLTQKLSTRHAITGSWGRFSQIPVWWQGDQLLMADHAGLRYSWRYSESWTLRAETFWQHITDAPALQYPDGLVSGLDESEAPVRYVFENKSSSEGRNYGLELSAERLLSDGWFMAANTTLFDARTRIAGGQWQKSRWNLRHILNLTAGKEWQKQSSGDSDKVKSFGFGGRAVWTGGLHALPVDAAQSALEQTTVFSAANGFTVQQPDFFRLDLRVYWKRSFGNRRNSTFAMDFQNVTMQENVAYQFYDPFTEKVETKYQLGLIPNLSWRLEF